MNRRALLLLVSLALVGCSTTATVSRTNGGPIEGYLVRSDADNVYVRPEYQTTETPVPRDEILDIDHPGNVHLLIGTIIGGSGLLTMIPGLVLVASPDRVEQQIGSQQLLAGGAWVAVGAPMAIWGYLTWSESREALAPSSPEPESDPSDRRIVYRRPPLFTTPPDVSSQQRAE